MPFQLKKLTLQNFCLGIFIFTIIYIIIGIISFTITYAITKDIGQSIYGACILPLAIIPILLMIFSCCLVFAMIFSDIKNNCCYDKLDSFYIQEDDVDRDDSNSSLLIKNPLEIEYGF